MDLSILIVNWNTRELLRDCLQSVYAGLGALRAEVIVVDNASADGSADMVDACFSRATLIRNDANVGFAAANNQAMKIARGRHLLLLNSDTIVHGDVLSRSVQYLDENSQVGMMGCKVLNADGTTQMTCSRYPSFLNLLLQTTGANRVARIPWLQRYQMLDWQRDDERPVEVVSGCYLMIRRAALDAIGGMDESFFLYGEETDWCRRCADAGWDLRFAPVGTITHFGSGSSRQLNHQRDVLLSEGTVRLHRKHGGTLPAIALWLLLLGFNASRSVFWSLRTAVSGSRQDLERAAHFRRVVRNFHCAWPAAAERRT